MTPKTIISLSNASTVTWDGAHAADIAGLVQAGQDKVFSVADVVTGHTVYVVVSQVISWYEITS